MSSAIWNLFLHAAIAVVVLFLVEEVKLGPGAIGLLFSVGSAAALVGAAGAPWLARHVGTAPIIWLSVTVTTPFALLVPLTRPGWWVGLYAVSTAVCALGQVVYNVAQLSLRQAICPPELQGRVNASTYLLVMGAAPLVKLKDTPHPAARIPIR